MTPIPAAAIFALLEQGLTQAQAAAALGVRPDVLCRRLRQIRTELTRQEPPPPQEPGFVVYWRARGLSDGR